MSPEGELTAHTEAPDLAELEKLTDLSGHFLQPIDEEAFRLCQSGAENAD